MVTAEPPYARIVAEIRGRIAAGELRPGDRVPSTRQITREWGVAMATATKVLTALRQEGLVQSAPGVGTVVAAPRPGAASRAAAAPGTAPASRPAGPHHPRRGSTREPRELTRAQVVRTALALVDREGLAGLSMRRIATELGVATMSLYRHVRSKDELVKLMVDAVFAVHAPPEPPPPGWRAQLDTVARLQWDIYRRHPWLAHVMSFVRPPLAPHAMAHTEWTMRAFDGLGLPVQTVFVAAVSLANFVRGTAVNFEPEAQAEQDTGLTEDQWMQTQEAEFRRVLGSGRFPVMTRAVTTPGFEFDLDEVFEFGLHRMLDGLASVIGR